MEGLEITAVREMTDEEYEELVWPIDNMGRARVIELDDGTRLFPSCDPEGNHAGIFWGIPDDTDELVGETIEAVKRLTDHAMRDRGWPVQNPHIPAPPVLEVSSGAQIYPVQDGEGNGPGTLFGIEPPEEGGEAFAVIFEEQ